jgi:hypothetical protein
LRPGNWDAECPSRPTSALSRAYEVREAAPAVDWDKLQRRCRRLSRPRRAHGVVWCGVVWRGVGVAVVGDRSDPTPTKALRKYRSHWGVSPAESLAATPGRDAAEPLLLPQKHVVPGTQTQSNARARPASDARALVPSSQVPVGQQGMARARSAASLPDNANADSRQQLQGALLLSPYAQAVKTSGLHAHRDADKRPAVKELIRDNAQQLYTRAFVDGARRARTADSDTTETSAALSGISRALGWARPETGAVAEEPALAAEDAGDSATSTPGAEAGGANSRQGSASRHPEREAGPVQQGAGQARWKGTRVMSANSAKVRELLLRSMVETRLGEKVHQAQYSSSEERAKAVQRAQEMKKIEDRMVTQFQTTRHERRFRKNDEVSPRTHAEAARARAQGIAWERRPI